jgi:signal transduction histidine kinase
VTATRSLRSRLAWSASAVVALWLAVLAVGANLLLGAALARQADTLLEARAEATATTVEVLPGGRLQVSPERDDAALDVGTWILGPRGSVLERPPHSSPALDARASRLAGLGRVTDDVGLTERVRLLAHPISDGGRQVATVVTSTSLAPYDQLRRLAWLASAVLVAGLLVVVHLVLRANVGRSLRPVQEMTASADRWSADDVDRRFGGGRRPAELDQLARTLDAVLDRLGAVLRRERQLSDELSHELRTPLARIRTEVDLLRSRPRDPAEQAAAHASIGEAATVMQGIIDTLMSSARAGSASLSGRSDPRPVLERTAGRLRDQHPGLDVAVRLDSGAPVGVEAALLERLLAPVAENAGRFARRRVELTGTRDGPLLRLLVADDGPGIPAGQRDRVFEPGWRGSAGDGHPGAGLGLALARRLADAAGGRVTVLDEGPGARFAIELPLA